MYSRIHSFNVDSSAPLRNRPWHRKGSSRVSGLFKTVKRSGNVSFTSELMDSRRLCMLCKSVQSFVSMKKRHVATGGCRAQRLTKKENRLRKPKVYRLSRHTFAALQFFDPNVVVCRRISSGLLHSDIIFIICSKTTSGTGRRRIWSKGFVLFMIS